MTRKIPALIVLAALIGLLWSPSAPVEAQTSARPFSLPFAVPPGPSSWFSGQQYGNTTGAFNFGRYWYGAGQGLHFGLDLSAPCGTPVVAIADGVVEYVDNFAFGIRPHNVILSHRDLGYTSAYGHLRSKSKLVRGQPIRRGDVVGETGDPDETCFSRPHLHLEIRSLDYRTAYSPAALIDADWPMLMSIGSPAGPGGSAFTKDLSNVNRWQSVESQPAIVFGGRRLNGYQLSWPLASRLMPPALALPAVVAPQIADQPTPVFTQLTGSGCCSLPWWSHDSRYAFFYNGVDNEQASVWAVPVEGGTPQVIADSAQDLYTRTSPDGRYAIIYSASNGNVAIMRRSDNRLSLIATDGAYPRFSPGSTRILWQRVPGDNIPGAPPPRTQVWVANPDGEDRRLVTSLTGGSVFWLDDDRVMTSVRNSGDNTLQLTIHDLRNGAETPLIKAFQLRGLAVSPGGRYLIYYLAFQPDPAANGMYLLETTGGATPVKLPWFGSYRWRDSTSAVYIPFAPGQPMQFTLYDIVSATSRLLTDPARSEHRFAIANDDWSISPDGRTILYWDAVQYALWSVRL